MADAREEARELRRQVRDGRNPLLIGRCPIAATARQAIVPASIDLTPTSAIKSDEESFVIQLRRIEYVLSEDSIERSVTRVYRYLQSDGVRDYGNIRTHFNGASDLVEIRHAMVVTSAGAIHVIEPETVQVLPTDTVNVFSDSKFVLLPLMGLDTGSEALCSFR